MKMHVKTTGFDDAKKILDALPDKVQKKTIEQIFKKSVTPMMAQMKSNLIAHGSNYGALADAIGFINVSTERTHPLVITGIRVKGKYKYIGYYGAWVEYGVKGVKTKLSSTVKKTGDDTFRVWMRRVKKGEQYRADQPAKPFMRPAIDAQIGGVQLRVISGMQTFVHSETGKLVAQHKTRS